MVDKTIKEPVQVRALKKALELLKKDESLVSPEGRYIVKILGTKSNNALKRKQKKLEKSPEKSAWDVQLKKTDKIFQKYCRYRDSYIINEERFFDCCTCGKRKEFKKAQGGHYIPRLYKKSWGTRWIETNCNAQCNHCNRNIKGIENVYTKFMENKYGQAEIDKLWGVHKLLPGKPSIEYMEELEKLYNNKMDNY